MADDIDPRGPTAEDHRWYCSSCPFQSGETEGAAAHVSDMEAFKQDPTKDVYMSHYVYERKDDLTGRARRVIYMTPDGKTRKIGPASRSRARRRG